MKSKMGDFLRHILPAAIPRGLQNCLIAPLSGILMLLYTKYLTMCKVHMHAGAIRKLLYGCEYVLGDNPLAQANGLSSR